MTLDTTDMAQLPHRIPSENALAPERPSTGIQALPVEVFQHIAQYLEPHSINACLTVCHAFYDGLIESYYSTLGITILGRPPCQRDPSLALAVNPPNLIASMRRSEATAQRAALAQYVSMYLDPAWDCIMTATSPNLEDLVWLFQHLKPVDLQVSTTAKAHFLHSALLEVLSLDRLRILGIAVSEDEPDETSHSEGFELEPFKRTIGAAAKTLAALSMPSEEHKDIAPEEGRTAEMPMPAVFPKLADIDIICEGPDASYAADIVVRSPVLSRLTLNFANSADALAAALHLIDVADGDITSLDLQSRAGYPYGFGGTPAEPVTTLDLSEHDNILHLDVLSVNGPAFHLFPPKLRTLGVDRIHLSWEETSDETTDRDALDGGQQTALQQLRELLARPDWQSDLKEIRLGSSQKLFGRRLYMPPDLQAIMKRACEQRGIVLTLLNCDEKDYSRESGSDPPFGSDPADGGGSFGDSDPGGMGSVDGSSEPGMVSHTIPQGPAGQAHANHEI